MAKKNEPDLSEHEPAPPYPQIVLACQKGSKTPHWYYYVKETYRGQTFSRFDQLAWLNATELRVVAHPLNSPAADLMIRSANHATPTAKEKRSPKNRSRLQ